MNISTTLAGGGLVARFGDAFTDQSYDARLEGDAGIGLAASAHDGETSKEHTASKGVALIPDVTVLRITLNGTGLVTSTRHRRSLQRRCVREVLTAGGFSRVRRAAATPFNLVLEARP